MDPEVALAELREAISEAQPILARGAGTLAKLDHADEALAALDRLGEAAGVLDEWLSEGGYLPTDWARARKENTTMSVLGAQQQVDRAKTQLGYLKKELDQSEPRMIAVVNIIAAIGEALDMASADLEWCQKEIAELN